METRTLKVAVKTSARLHLGLIDLNGDLGRLFGGFGVGIDHPNIVLTAETSKTLSIRGKERELVSSLVRRFCETFHITARFSIIVKEAIPAHSGLGSGTQLALAVAVALSRLSHTKASIPELALAMGRAKRTG